MAMLSGSELLLKMSKSNVVPGYDPLLYYYANEVAVRKKLVTVAQKLVRIWISHCFIPGQRNLVETKKI